VRTLFNALAVAAVAAAVQACPASAQQNYADQLTPTPDIEKVGGRYILMVLDQPDRDLVHGRTKVNVLVDTKTGKTWLLEYARKPDSNEVGYVWSEIPFAQAPGQ
jgi:serine protease inhibitor ecotin